MDKFWEWMWNEEENREYGYLEDNIPIVVNSDVLGRNSECYATKQMLIGYMMEYLVLNDGNIPVYVNTDIFYNILKQQIEDIE
jgi:hypothetical protein